MKTLLIRAVLVGITVGFAKHALEAKAGVKL